MTPTSRRAAMPVLLCTLLALLLSGCGAGGFSETPATTGDNSLKHYVALGDGYTAAPYDGTTQTARGCLRSDQNYPAILASKLGIAQYTDVSCTGATTNAVTGVVKAPDGRGQLNAQIDAVTNQTDLVTIEVGIQDQHYLRDLFNVCMALPCGTRVPVGFLAKRIASIGLSVVDLIRQVQTKAPTAYVVVLGYPSLAPPTGGCAQLPPLDKEQLIGVDALMARFNAELGDDARQMGAAFLDVDSLTQGHDPCSAEPWVNGKNSAAGSAVAYHPRGREQSIVADALAELVKTR